MRKLAWFMLPFVLVVVVAVAVSAPAHAQVATDAARVTWTPATQLVTGAPIPAPPDPLSLKTTRIQRSIASTCASGAFGTVAQVLNLPADVTTAFFENLLPAGRHCFRVAHIQENDGISAWSAVASKIIVIPPPPVPPKSKPPTVTIE